MNRREPHVGIERKILTSILWVGILPMTVALIVGYITARGGQSSAVQQTLRTAAQKTVEGLQLVYDLRIEIAAENARDPNVAALLTAEDADPEQAQRLLKRLAALSANSQDGPSIVSVYNDRGELIHSSDPSLAESFLAADRLEPLPRSEFLAFGASPGESRFGSLILTSIPHPEDGQRLGILTIFSGVDTLFRFAMGESSDGTDAGESYDHYQIVYIDEDDRLTILYLDDQAQLTGMAEDASNSDLRNILAVQEESGVRPRSGSMLVNNYDPVGSEKNADVLLAYHRVFETVLDNQILYLVIYRPASEVFSNITALALLALVGCILFIAFLCVNAYRDVHNNIVRPVSLLNEGAQIIRQGDFDLKLKIGTGDEIEELASSFNKMALALKANTERLGESEEKYRNLVTSMHDGIFQTDQDGVITFLNPAGVRILGFDDEKDAAGRNLSELFVQSDDIERFLEGMDETESGERTRVWMIRRDNRTICVEMTCNRIYTDRGHPGAIEGSFRDITTGVRLEEAARERSERISSINQIANVINSSLEAGRLYESLVVELMKLVNFDYASVALLKNDDNVFDGRQLWPDEEMPPGYTFTLVSDDSYAAWVAGQRKCLLVDDLDAGDAPYRDQFPPTVISCLCVPLYASGRIIGTLNLGSRERAAYSQHDVTVLEEMSPHLAVAIRNAQLLVNLQLSLEEVTRGRERLHKANEELKSLDEMKTNLLSNVSHELRTPLVSVMGYSDMILSGKAGPINSMQQEYLGISLRNVEKLVTLIENLLDFSRLHRGDEHLISNVFDLVDCARTSIKIIQPVIESRTIVVDLTTPQEPVLVEGDKEKMGQVFNNLLSNAVKFNQNGGRVWVKMKLGDDFVEASVSDNGIGIHEEALEKVFTRFYQYDGSSTRKYGGTGIGLSIAQDILRLHGSSITVSSTEGQGSVFRFRLSLAGVRTAGEDDRHLALPPAQETHLLVEVISGDRPLSIQIRNILLEEGMDTIHASNPDNAIALAQKHSPDCLVVDLNHTENPSADLDSLLQNSVTGILPLIVITTDDGLYERYRSLVAARIGRDLRKSTLLGGIHHALSQGVAIGEPLGEKVLCIDDDQEILTFMCRCLEAEGFIVDTCESGEEGIERLSGGEYGLVLLDIAMPGMDGWETCRKIRANPELGGIKIYMVTAKPIEESVSRVQESGADGFLLKPFRPEDLVELAQGLAIRSAAK